MKRYKIRFNEGSNDGVFAMSLVDSPAMESNFIALNKQINFAEVDPERKILLGVALIPDKPIYRNDENGEYELIFDKQTIEKTAHEFVKRGKVNNATEQHEIQLGEGTATVVESWVIEDDIHDKTRKFGLQEPVGSWAIMMKVNDEALYQKAKNGELKGFSIEGLFDVELLNLNKESMNLETITKAIETGFESVKASLSIAEPEAPEATPEAVVETQPETPEASIEEILNELFTQFGKDINTKFQSIETRLEAQEKTIAEQDKKLVEYGKQPASEPKKSAPVQVDLSKLSRRERLLHKIKTQ